MRGGGRALGGGEAEHEQVDGGLGGRVGEDGGARPAEGGVDVNAHRAVAGRQALVGAEAAGAAEHLLGQVLEDVITVKLVFGGVTGAIAEKASKWGGDQDTWHGTKANLRQERAFPPERICGLPVGSVFIKHRSTRAFIARLGRVEDHPRYEPAFPADFPADVRAPVPQPAIEAPRRAPIAPPYTPPAIADAAITEEESWLESPATSCAG